jgi:tetratricopeptide (TPR) repeat protein
VSLFGKLFARGGKNEPRPQPAMLTVYNELGREMQISREQWRTNVLPGAIQSHWSDPERLSSVVVQALEDGFGGDVLAAAKHLHEIDGDAERGACLYGVVLMEKGDLRKAERIFTAGLQKRPRSGALLTNLAKVHHRRGNQKLAGDTLWRALNADPNFDNALMWYAALGREGGGDAGYKAALKRVAGLRGSWRANLWLAREHLAAKELENALALYESVLVVAADERGVLTQISGDLGQNGFVAEVLRLVLPFYDPKRHELLAGGNLLQACVQLGDVARGERLLHEMMLVAGPPDRERLMWYSARFSEMTAAPPAPEPQGDLNVHMIQLDQPIWTSGLGDVDWLMPPRAPSSLDIAVLAFSVKVEHGGLLHKGEMLVGREDRIGRWSRALALHLTDGVRFRTDGIPVTLLPVITGKGMLASGQEWSADAV